MSELLQSHWSAAIGLIVVAAWILMACAIFFPGKPRNEDGDDGRF